LVDLYITPGLVNCFSCALDAGGSVNWQVELDGDLVPASTSPDVAVDGNFLLLLCLMTMFNLEPLGDEISSVLTLLMDKVLTQD
jgi:hypothetical protein